MGRPWPNPYPGMGAVVPVIGGGGGVAGGAVRSSNCGPSFTVSGVVIVVAWCAWLCSVVHLLQHRSSNRRRGEPDPDRLAREHDPLNLDWRATRARFAQL